MHTYIYKAHRQKVVDVLLAHSHIHSLTRSGAHRQNTRIHIHTHKFLTLLLPCWLYFFNVVSFYFRSFIRSLVRPFSVCALISTFALMRHSYVCLYIILCMCMLGLFGVCMNIYKNGIPTQNNPLAAGLVSGSKSKRQPLYFLHSLSFYIYVHTLVCV